ncbi:UNVERIFIED_CONTAM: Retrovirus-related Pol polyprotein from transposon RE1 [Sesamum radiatum]|uniref:Retrovirus-related Pol polyprotein from transposon RE1 n=1 Tax=Sesamum radiatum TaxID=300843 RepID=A0AAW2TX96_SESRA
MMCLESLGSCEEVRQNILEITWDENDFENQGYVLDKPLPTALPKGSSPEEHLTFDKWLEDNRKVRSIILASMTNEIQKQYDRFEDVPSIMLHTKEVYAVPDRHIRYVGTKAFFGTKMAEGLFGVKMLSLVEKLEDLKVGFENDTYIDVILWSLPPSYDQCIVTYNMNGFEKSIHELINMLVQYEAMTHKSEPTVLVGEASTSKAKGKGARRWKRKKGKETEVTTTFSARGAPAASIGKGKGKVGGSQRSRTNDVCMHCHGQGHWKRECPQLLSNPDRIRRLVDSNNLEIDDLDHLPTCKSCLKGKMTKEPFFGQSAVANSLLDLVHTDVCGPLSTPARGGFSYLITFTDDHSRYCYVYLMGYKSEAFGRFQEYGLEVENQTGGKIKALWSNEVHDSTTSFEPPVHTDGVPVLRRLTRESRVPERYGFVGLTSQLDNDLKTYGEVMSDINSDNWLEAMNPRWTRWVQIKSIYGLKQASQSWNTRFDEVIRGYDFIKNDYDPCIYKKISGSSVAYLVLYVDDILLIGNDFKMLGDIKAWLSTQFSMKDMGYSNASFQSDDDDAKSQSDFVFKLNGGMVAWKSSKQDTTVDFTKEVEYIATSEAVKEAVWMKNYI